jgi:hypothetical protein
LRSEGCLEHLAVDSCMQCMKLLCGAHLSACGRCLQ